jgi:hypothetical protein
MIHEVLDLPLQLIDLYSSVDQMDQAVPDTHCGLSTITYFLCLTSSLKLGTAGARKSTCSSIYKQVTS